ncbi:putative terminase, endonuclease subunit [Pseudomonas amygdali pv. eriobotryae]|uniref:Putative terminase, endonuclease subunit n=1 Tax=Pseudomonas amygdali pv. eriobotryae TaxID=129137 RepID=A0A0P9Q9A0_PSEA0|nr:putative terminase, endonuclease subunit [Pseudomonas amygdali pv. eriobotryae]RML95083.1 putative terminase, endonuclease subunit [Pseudomonas amygdali pv. eriobotryae]RMO60258.1 putative terminase, endonuclease subunit [Pseudomonas amygdali pv. eriobotryae]GFZ61335.1 hypothetical protein PSE10A_38460 [Pseudomonas amygdali pv. eriobotryae]GFZ73125.1 hypothetical protein PSE10C_38670 [Pseudomonas amygdali pv. eriobotryae]
MAQSLSAYGAKMFAALQVALAESYGVELASKTFSVEPSIAQELNEAITQLFERIPARYHKLLGMIALHRKDWPVAIQHFERAEQLYESIGVGTRLANCRKALAKAQANENAGNGTE